MNDQAMNDQAAELRQLVLRASRRAPVSEAVAPHVIVLAGGKGGVGVTTLAVNLSLSLSRLGARLVLVDASLTRSDVAAMCGLPERDSLAEVVEARRDIHEVLQRGPEGLQILPGVWAPRSRPNDSHAGLERLLTQILGLGRHADLVLIDVGGQRDALAERCWRAADQVLLVTTPDSVAVMDAYAAIKSRMPSAGTPAAAPLPVRLLVNQCESTTQAMEIFQRIDRSCRRFLQGSIHFVGCVPHDESMATAGENPGPLLIRRPAAPAASAVDRIAEELWLVANPARHEHEVPRAA